MRSAISRKINSKSNILNLFSKLIVAKYPMSILKDLLSAAIWLKVSAPIKLPSIPMRLWMTTWLKHCWTTKYASKWLRKKNQACWPVCFTACCLFCCWSVHGSTSCACKAAVAVKAAHSLLVRAVHVYWTKIPIKLLLPMLPVVMRLKKKYKKSWIIWNLLIAIKAWVVVYRAVFCWPVALVRVKPCWLKRLLVRPVCHSSVFQVLTS